MGSEYGTCRMNQGSAGPSVSGPTDVQCAACVDELLFIASSSHPPSATLEAASAPHAKRMLGPGGALSEALGSELKAGAIARAMRSEELHPDVHALFGRIGALSGLVESPPEVVIRTPLG